MKGKETKILIIGTTVVDVMVQNQTLKASVFIGGKGYNIAMNTSTLGSPVFFCSSLGNDEYAQKAKTDLKNNNVAIVSAQIKNSTTGVYFSLYDSSSEPIFDASRIPKLTSDILPKNIKNYNMICLISGVENDIYEAILEAKKINANTRFCVSLSGRKSAQEIIPYLSHIDILFSNKKETIALVQKITGITKTFNVKFCLDELYKAGIRSVVTTDGANGIYFKDKDGQGRAVAQKIQSVVSTLGAGDAVVATVMHNHFTLSNTLSESCKIASFVSAKIVQQKSSLILKN